MTCKLLNTVSASLTDLYHDYLHLTVKHICNSRDQVLSRALSAGLLFACLVVPGIAQADIPERCFADTEIHRSRNKETGNNEVAGTEPAGVEQQAASSPALVKYLEQQNCADTDNTVSLLMTGIEIAGKAGYKTPDPLLLACLAKPESKFDDNAVGRAGERGLLQIHPCHKRSMARMGLDFNSGADRVAYACVLWSSSGLQPWSTRRAAMRDYRAWSEK